jgi:hypothetical protein
MFAGAYTRPRHFSPVRIEKRTVRRGVRWGITAALATAGALLLHAFAALGAGDRAFRAPREALLGPFRADPVLLYGLMGGIAAILAALGLAARAPAAATAPASPAARWRVGADGVFFLSALASAGLVAGAAILLRRGADARLAGALLGTAGLEAVLCLALLPLALRAPRRLAVLIPGLALFVGAGALVAAALALGART